MEKVCSVANVKKKQTESEERKAEVDAESALQTNFEQSICLQQKLPKNTEIQKIQKNREKRQTC